MDAATMLRGARRRADLSQAALAERSGTSQATISAYESGTKEPSAKTLARLLAATGHRLAAEHTGRIVVVPSTAELTRRGRILAEVLEFSESFPARRRGELRFPRIPVREP